MNTNRQILINILYRVFSWICQSLLQGFITVVARICQKWSCISRPLPNQTKLKISKLIEVFASAVELMWHGLFENTNSVILMSGFGLDINFICSTWQSKVAFFALIGKILWNWRLNKGFWFNKSTKVTK